MVQMLSLASEHNHHLDYRLVLDLVVLVDGMQVERQMLFIS